MNLLELDGMKQNAAKAMQLALASKDAEQQQLVQLLNWIELDITRLIHEEEQSLADYKDIVGE